MSNDEYTVDGLTFDAVLAIYASASHRDEYVLYCPECDWEIGYADLPQGEVGYYVKPPWCPECGPGAEHLLRTDRSPDGGVVA